MKAIGGAISSVGKKKAAKAQQEAENAYLAESKAGQQKYLDYLAGRGPETTTTQGTTSDYSQTLTDMLQSPEMTAQFSPLVERMNQIMTERLAGPGAGLPAGYAENAARAINESYAPQLAAEQNLMARFGGGVSSAMPVSAAGRARAGALATMRGELPLKVREMETQDIGLAQQLANIFGKGTRQRGSTSTTSTGSRFGTTVAPPIVAPYQAFMPISPKSTAAAGSGWNMLGQMAGGAGEGLSLFNAFRASAPGGGGGGSTPPPYYLANPAPSPFDFGG